MTKRTLKYIKRAWHKRAWHATQPLCRIGSSARTGLRGRCPKVDLPPQSPVPPGYASMSRGSGNASPGMTVEGWEPMRSAPIAR